MWDGVDFKFDNASLFYDNMVRSLQPAIQGRTSVVLVSSPGTAIGTQWQRELYANFDAFLAMARSVPEIINFCFGKDASCDNKKNPMHGWFNSLDATERTRRTDFSSDFKNAGYDSFKQLSLSNARNITLHRQGYPAATFTISGHFGVVSGTPVNHVPETHAPAGSSPNQQLLPLQPTPADFTIDGKPLFDECKAYLRDVGKLVKEAREIFSRVHGSAMVTPPPP
ncbi:hypothetical protein EGT07_14380 [Herbaspirillum sp. HC18]|nr:hypothetical protein EGT07_14380 [Herbaspirillum sp. HC18]